MSMLILMYRNFDVLMDVCCVAPPGEEGVHAAVADLHAGLVQHEDHSVSCPTMGNGF